MKQQLAKLNFSEILSSEIEFYGHELGKGSFGKVFGGRCRGKEVVIKILQNSINDESPLLEFKKEVEIMSTIFHPNICLFMGACTEPGNFFIVSEFLAGGNVEKLLRDSKVKLSLFERIKMAKDAALGVNWLHCSNPNVIHRDLKTSNLLLDENGKVKVCDFGLSQFKNPGETLKDNKSAKGTPLWMAPEIMQFKTFDEKSDVYSFGIVLWEFLTRQKPFAHHKDYQVFRHAVCKQGERPTIPKDADPRLKDLIEKCWSADPVKRPTISEILNELDIILINVAVEDSYGRYMWMKNFLKYEKFCAVPWSKFEQKLLSFLKIEASSEMNGRIELNMKCLKKLLINDGANNASDVSLLNFGRILKWFGPMASKNLSGRTFLDDIRETMANVWFHGDIDKNTAESRLLGKKLFTFLVRFSSVQGSYTLSFLTHGNKIRHRRIENSFRHDFYMINNCCYKSLESLVKGQASILRYPCSGSMYQILFNENDDQFEYI